jgi:hypothetical protein
MVVKGLRRHFARAGGGGGRGGSGAGLQCTGLSWNASGWVPMAFFLSFFSNPNPKPTSWGRARVIAPICANPSHPPQPLVPSPSRGFPPTIVVGAFVDDPLSRPYGCCQFDDRGVVRSAGHLRLVRRAGGAVPLEPLQARLRPHTTQHRTRPLQVARLRAWLGRHTTPLLGIDATPKLGIAMVHTRWLVGSLPSGARPLPRRHPPTGSALGAIVEGMEWTLCVGVGTVMGGPCRRLTSRVVSWVGWWAAA